MSVENLRFLSEQQVDAIQQQFGSPVFVYSEASIEEQIAKVLSFPVNEGYGLTARFAMKASPTRQILRIMHKHGVLIDASSEHEVQRALRAGSSSAVAVWILLTLLRRLCST